MVKLPKGWPKPYRKRYGKSTTTRHYIINAEGGWFLAPLGAYGDKAHAEKRAGEYKEIGYKARVKRLLDRNVKGEYNYYVFAKKPEGRKK